MSKKVKRQEKIRSGQPAALNAAVDSQPGKS